MLRTRPMFIENQCSEYPNLQELIMFDLKKMFGTAINRLVRKNDPETSFEAAAAIDTTKMEKLVYEAICGFPDGCISDDILAMFPQYPYSTITARYKPLYEKGFIIIDGVRKGKSGRSQRVMRKA
jgi:hypothetical protein